MFSTKNHIGNIENTQIEEINQTNIEKQENYLTINKFQMNCANDRFIQMAMSHSLFPYFTVDFAKMNDGKYRLMSKPTKKESVVKYPLNFKGSFTILDDRYKDIKDKQKMMDIIQFSDTPVEIKLNKFEQYLGDVLDPYPNPELSPMQEGVRSYIMPKKRELPKIKWNVDICFNDSKFKLTGIQLKLVKQLSSNTFLFNNYHQNLKPVALELKLEINDEYVTYNLKYKINETRINDCKTVFTFNTFVLNLLTKSYYMYERCEKKIIMFGECNGNVSQEEIESLQYYINIIEKILEIEKYFNITFNIPNEISKDDVMSINELYRFIMSSKKKEKGINAFFTIFKKNMNIEKVRSLINMQEVSLVSVSENVVFNILGVDIEIKKIIVKFNDVKCSNTEEVNDFISKIDKFDDTDTLKLIMIPTKGKYLYKITEIVK